MSNFSLPSVTPDPGDFGGSSGGLTGFASGARMPYGAGGFPRPFGLASSSFFDQGQMKTDGQTNQPIATSIAVDAMDGETEDEALSYRMTESLVFIVPLRTHAQMLQLSLKHMGGGFQGLTTGIHAIYSLPSMNLKLRSGTGRRVFNTPSGAQIVNQFRFMGTERGMGQSVPSAAGTYTIVHKGRTKTLGVWPTIQVGQSAWLYLHRVIHGGDTTMNYFIKDQTRTKFHKPEALYINTAELAKKALPDVGTDKYPLGGIGAAPSSIHISGDATSANHRMAAVVGTIKASSADTKAKVHQRFASLIVACDIRRGIESAKHEALVSDRSIVPNLAVMGGMPGAAADIQSRRQRSADGSFAPVDENAPLPGIPDAYWKWSPYVCSRGGAPPMDLYVTDDFVGTKCYIGTLSHHIGPVIKKGNLPVLEEYLGGLKGWQKLAAGMTHTVELMLSS
jgi:hypothetical protein